MNIKSDRGNKTFDTEATRIFEALQGDIVYGKLQPGSRLIRRDLCRRFTVSQATVSEALWRLESEGLAESVPMYGTRVMPMTLERVRNEIVLREALECQVARLLAERASTLNRKRLTSLAGALDTLQRKEAGHNALHAHQAFHITLARFTDFHLLEREMERIWRRHVAFFTWHSARILPPPEHWHQRLLDAIFTGNPDVAECKMREHVRYGSARQLDVLREIESAVSQPEKTGIRGTGSRRAVHPQ